MRQAELVEALMPYLQHENDCILTYWSAGEPRKDGSYWCKIKDTWYQQSPVDETPKCNCGLDELYAQYKSTLV